MGRLKVWEINPIDLPVHASSSDKYSETAVSFYNIGHLRFEPIAELSMVDADFIQKVSNTLYKRIILHTGFIYSFYIQSRAI
jgi:hypothetical protein